MDGRLPRVGSHKKFFISTRNGMAKKEKEVPDCLTCGVCYANVMPSDLLVLGKRFVKKYVLVDSLLTQVILEAMVGRNTVDGIGAIRTVWRMETSGPFRSWEMNRCVCLCGSVMQKVKCRIYEKRPWVCRTALYPGEKACLKERQLFQDMLSRIKKDA
jgi:Fe-S-cluster containining protein